MPGYAQELGGQGFAQPRACFAELEEWLSGTETGGQIAELTQAGFILPGTLTERMTRCGYPRCRCRADPPQLHGPYHQWTRKINGKTVTRILSDDQLADYQPWFDNQRRLRDLITDLETLSQEIADNDPRWHR
jgi:hypothetical protein